MEKEQTQLKSLGLRNMFPDKDSKKRPAPAGLFLLETKKAVILPKNRRKNALPHTKTEKTRTFRRIHHTYNKCTGYDDQEIR